MRMLKAPCESIQFVKLMRKAFCIPNFACMYICASGEQELRSDIVLNPDRNARDFNQKDSRSMLADNL